MAINNEQEKIVKQIAKKLDESKEIIIQDRKITKEDITGLDDYAFISTPHPKGFNILIRRKYSIELVLNIPTLMFSTLDEYIVADSLFGEHGLIWSAKDCVEYVDGLLGN